MRRKGVEGRHVISERVGKGDREMEGRRGGDGEKEKRWREDDRNGAAQRKTARFFPGSYMREGGKKKNWS